MTVGELMDKLKEYPKEAEVYYNTCGWHDVITTASVDDTGDVIIE